MDTQCVRACVRVCHESAQLPGNTESQAFKNLSEGTIDERDRTMDAYCKCKHIYTLKEILNTRAVPCSLKRAP